MERFGDLKGLNNKFLESRPETWVLALASASLSSITLTTTSGLCSIGTEMADSHPVQLVLIQ